jgi:hypothetical protein
MSPAVASIVPAPGNWSRMVRAVMAASLYVTSSLVALSVVRVPVMPVAVFASSTCALPGTGARIDVTVLPPATPFRTSLSPGLAMFRSKVVRPEASAALAWKVSGAVEAVQASYPKVTPSAVTDTAIFIGSVRRFTVRVTALVPGVAASWTVRSGAAVPPASIGVGTPTGTSWIRGASQMPLPPKRVVTL